MSAPQDKRPEYRLVHEPDGRSWTARENLVDILERELLGPANGPEEVLDGVPDTAYLIGRIAPVRLTAGHDDLKEADSEEAATDVGDAVDAEESRGVPVTAVDESGAGADEDTAEDEPQRRGLMIPASMGLRCQIPDDLDSFTVTASWGQYERVKEKAEKQTFRRRYQRTPLAITTTVTVA
ncbi:MAG: DISARM system helicase DrmA, partial [Pseudonocardiaceae bacterium]